MLRRTGFARRVYTPAPPAPPARATRTAVLADCAAAAASIERTEPHRNRRLLDLARGMPCLLRVSGTCNGDATTTVACHSNLGIHGKSGARKADDEYSVWGCAACHRWLDQGPAPAAAKRSAFMAAHLRQVLEWRHIATFDGHAEPDRAAARWALEHLNAVPAAIPFPLE